MRHLSGSQCFSLGRCASVFGPRGRIGDPRRDSASPAPVAPRLLRSLPTVHPSDEDLSLGAPDLYARPDVEREVSKTVSAWQKSGFGTRPASWGSCYPTLNANPTFRMGHPLVRDGFGSRKAEAGPSTPVAMLRSLRMTARMGHPLVRGGCGLRKAEAGARPTCYWERCGE
jgi:hypothetical protein